MLGPIRIADLTTANIRQWHKALSCQISVNTANVAKKLLQSSLALVAEDFDLRVPALPTKLGRRRMKPKKRILTSDQIALLLQAAIKDRYRGIYYAFPFMTGTRASEQLALLWRDVDLTAGVIRIRRMQERGGSIVELTKTEASAEIPDSTLLSMMLRDWLLVCPRRDGELHRVFPVLVRTTHGLARAEMAVVRSATRHFSLAIGARR
jgi:integrase